MQSTCRVLQQSLGKTHIKSDFEATNSTVRQKFVNHSAFQIEARTGLRPLGELLPRSSTALALT